MALLAVAQWEWQAQDENQLDVAEGSTVELLNVEDAEWWQVRLPAEPTPAVGWVPASHLAVVEADEPAHQAAAVSSTDPDVMREYLAMLSSSEDFSAEDLRAVCEEEGVAFGAGDREAIARVGRVAVVLGMGFMTLTAAVMLLAPHAILRIYIDPDAPQNAAMVVLAIRYMTVAAAFQLFDGAQAVGAALLRGLQDTRVPMAFALFGYWVPGIGTAVALGLFTPLGGLGVWIGLMTGLVVVASLMLWRWNNRARLGLLPHGLLQH